jgi:hypothetical protein
MSTEICVVFHGDLPRRAALTRMFKQLGFPISFQLGSGGLERQEGFLPMHLRGAGWGIEFDTWDYRRLFAEFIKAAVDLPCGVSLRWGAIPEDRKIAICFAAALARLTDGLVIGLHYDRRLTADEAIGIARAELEAVENSGN